MIHFVVALLLVDTFATTIEGVDGDFKVVIEALETIVVKIELEDGFFGTSLVVDAKLNKLKELTGLAIILGLSFEVVIEGLGSFEVIIEGTGSSAVDLERVGSSTRRYSLVT